MKKLLLFLLLTGCCSTPSAPTRPLALYECALIGRHSVKAKIRGYYSYLEDAEDDAQKIKKQLIEKYKGVYENTGVMCFKVDNEQTN